MFTAFSKFLTLVVINLKKAFLDGSPASLAGSPNFCAMLSTPPVKPPMSPVKSTSIGLPSLSNFILPLPSKIEFSISLKWVKKDSPGSGLCSILAEANLPMLARVASIVLSYLFNLEVIDVDLLLFISKALTKALLAQASPFFLDLASACS